MTLEEAIKHCHEKAEEIRKANEEMPTDCKLSEDLCECAREHEQLAEWLKDYKRLLEMPKGDLISREDLKEALEVTQYNDIDDLTRTERLIDNAPTVEPCYQTTSCLDCKNYDKETHNCPRYCEIIKEAIKSRPQGEWYYNYQNGWHCSICHESVKDMPTVMCKANFAFCPNCGAKMKGGTE